MSCTWSNRIHFSNISRFYTKCIIIFQFLPQNVCKNAKNGKKSAIFNFPGPPVDQMLKKGILYECPRYSLQFCPWTIFTKVGLLVKKNDFQKLVFFISLYFFNKFGKCEKTTILKSPIKKFPPISFSTTFFSED